MGRVGVVQFAGGPMATRCNMIDWGCQRCPAGRRRTATNKGLHRLAVTPPRQRRRHCWSPHQSTKEGWGSISIFNQRRGRPLHRHPVLDASFNLRTLPPTLPLTPLPAHHQHPPPPVLLPAPTKVLQTKLRLPSSVCTIEHERIHHSSAA